jgi:CDP-glucose 4,6-dehydratase
MGITREFWRDKNVLITGHTGFKGGWLSAWLKMIQANVSGLALMPDSEPSLFNVAHISDGMSSHIGDIRDLEYVKGLIDEVRPDIVFHLAAQSLVRESYLRPVETFETNVIGTVNLLQAVRDVDSVRVVVNVTSDKCYENKGTDHRYNEDDPMGGDDPYSASKACTELAIAAMRSSFFENTTCQIASARAGNVFGGGDWAKDRLVPDLLMALSENRSAQIRNPNSIRPWQHVLEPLSGYIFLAERMWNDENTYSEGWNFGPTMDSEVTVAKIADMLVKIWNENASWKKIDYQETIMKEASYLKLDSSKSNNKLAWQPRWNLEQGLAKTVEWYKAFLRAEDVQEVTMKQISDFMEC